MENITTSLEYKEHSQFFSKFLDYKAQAHEGIAICIGDTTKVKKTFQLIYLLYSFTSNYISDREEIEKELNEILQIINKNPDNAINRMSKILLVISEKHENAELLPKKKKEQNLNADFWKLEQNLILKQIKKAGVDILCRSS